MSKNIEAFRNIMIESEEEKENEEPMFNKEKPIRVEDTPKNCPMSQNWQVPNTSLSASTNGSTSNNPINLDFEQLKQLLLIANNKNSKEETHYSSVLLQLSNQLNQLHYNDWRQAAGIIASSNVKQISGGLTKTLSNLAVTGNNVIHKKEEIKLFIIELLRETSALVEEEFNEIKGNLPAAILCYDMGIRSNHSVYKKKKQVEQNRVDRESRNTEGVSTKKRPLGGDGPKIIL